MQDEQNSAASRPRPFICGCAGVVLNDDERDFFTAAQPLGFILMARNCHNPAQVQALVADLRSCLRHDDAPILIDQEGGRVARLKAPHWPTFPAAALIGALYQRDAALGVELSALVGAAIGAELAALGITVNCAPVLDCAHTETHQAIGDRAFSADVAVVSALGQAYADGLLSEGVLPIMKHLPGHGHATVDPHLLLPKVSLPRDILQADFVPFRKLAALPLGMTSHILFEALDAALPASQSPTIIRDIIRRSIGFNGLLISDDLDMKALGDYLRIRADRVLAAGTDVLLICNAPIAELMPLAELAPMAASSWQRWERARNFLHLSKTEVANSAARLERIAALWALAAQHTATA